MGRALRKPSTITDVADRAGVSPSTVSRYLRGDRVRSAAKVELAINDLGFRPSPAAQSLKSGRTGAIAVVVPDVSNPFFAAVVRGADSISARDGYTLFLANTDESDEREAEIIDTLIGRVDGMLLAPASEHDPGPERLADAGVPTVLVDREVESSPSFDSVLIDNEGGARSAVEHLLGLGHERVATIFGPVESTPGRLRLKGYRAAMEAHGLEVDPEMVRSGGFMEHGGYQAMMSLLASPDPPTAVFVANNVMTIGALRAVKDLGVRIPTGLSLVGFDDHAFSEILDPPLTVVNRPMEEQGAIAMRLLMSRLSGATEGPKQIVLDTSIVLRGSTAGPRSGSISPEIVPRGP